MRDDSKKTELDRWLSIFYVLEIPTLFLQIV